MASTVIQLEVPRELRGRVISLYVSTLIGLPALGSLGVAALARAMGRGAEGAPRAVIVGAAALGVVLAIATPFLAREHARQ
jgi:hypothetical protein